MKKLELQVPFTDKWFPDGNAVEDINTKDICITGTNTISKLPKDGSINAKKIAMLPELLHDLRNAEKMITQLHLKTTFATLESKRALQVLEKIRTSILVMDTLDKAAEKKASKPFTDIDRKDIPFN